MWLLKHKDNFTLTSYNFHILTLMTLKLDVAICVIRT